MKMTYWLNSAIELNVKQEILKFFMNNSGEQAFVDEEPIYDLLKYKDTIYPSPILQYLHLLNQYNSRINSNSGCNMLLHYLFMIVLAIQIIIPSLFADSSILWNNDFFIQTVVKIFGVLSNGYYTEDGKTRIIISIVFSLILVACYILKLYLLYCYDKRKTISSDERTCVLTFYKYFFPILFPIIVSGIPSSILWVFQGKNIALALFSIIISIITLIWGNFETFFLSPRILLENSPNHYWIHTTQTRVNISLILITFVSCSVSLIPGIYSAAVCLVLAIIYLANAFYFLLYHPSLSYIYSCWLFSIYVSGGIVSLICLVCIILGNQISSILIVIYVLVTALAFFLGMMYLKYELSQAISIFSRLESNPDQEVEIFQQSYKRKSKFICHIRFMTNLFDPYFLSWKPFYFAMQTWPKSEEIMLNWSRVVAMFPNEETLFHQIMLRYSEIESKSRVSICYQMEMRDIVYSRVVVMIPTIKKSLQKLEKEIYRVKLLITKIFENILQKNISSFWNDIESVNRKKRKLETKIKQLYESYPNNKFVVSFYVKYLEEIERNPMMIKEWQNKKKVLDDGGCLEPDMGYSPGAATYPQLANLIQYSASYYGNEETETDLRKNFLPARARTVIELDKDEQLIQTLINLIHHTKLGNILVYIIIIFIGTALSIMCYIFLIQKYRDNMIRSYNTKALVIKELGSLMVDVTLVACSGCAYSARSDPILVQDVAPNYYNLMSPYHLTSEDILATAAKVRSDLDNLSKAFVSLREMVPETANIYKVLYTDPYKQGLSFTAYILQIILSISKDINNNFNQSVIFDDLSDIVYQIDNNTGKLIETILVEYNNYMNSINDLLVTTAIISILLIAFPFLMGIYSLSIISDSISYGFVILPNTSVREVLNQNEKCQQQNENETKNNDTATSALSERRQHKDIAHMASVVVSFLGSFCFVLALGLPVFYLAENIASTISYNFFQIQTVFFPLGHIRYAQFLIFNLYANKTDQAQNNRTGLIRDARSHLSKALDLISDGYWGNTEAIVYSQDFESNYFMLDLGNYTEKLLSETENLLGTTYEEGLAFMITESRYVLDMMENEGVLDYKQIVKGMIYYTTDFGDQKRDGPYMKAMNERIFEVFNMKDYYSVYFIALFIVLQLISAFVGSIYMIYKKNRMRSALYYFSYFPPNSILENHILMCLLESGKYDVENDKRQNTFMKPEEIFKVCPDPVAILDQNLMILDSNESFNRLFKYEIGPKKASLRSLMSSYISAKSPSSVDQLENRLKQSLEGEGEPNFDLSLTFHSLDDKMFYSGVNAIMVGIIGPIISQQDHQDIINIGLIFDDKTEIIQREQKIIKEQEKIALMLNKVMPEQISHHLQEGAESISFTVQSATIGCIRIWSDDFNECSNQQEIFDFYYKVFNKFDEVISRFTWLTKVRTFTRTYEFAGGLLTSVNKPEKHAEESISFCLKLLEIKEELEQSIGHKIDISSGLNTGGPLVGGILNINRPNFQLLGNDVEIAQQLKSRAKPSEIQITRSVYELIYAYNFNVQEITEIKFRDKPIRTYLVTQ